MRNKYLVAFLAAFLALGALCAQTNQNSDRTKTDRSAAAAKTRTDEMARLRFDPRKPSISMSYVSNVLDDKIQKRLLQKQLPEKLEEMNQDSDMFTSLYVSRYLFPFMAMMGNPDLEEVSRVPMRWYKAYAELLNGFRPVATEFSLALQQQNQKRYAAALEAFKKQQAACLAFLKKRKPRLSAEQLVKIRNANIRRRRSEYNERVKKEREEQRKRLLEKKSQKNTDQ